MESVKMFIDEREQHKREYENRVNERQMQSKEGKVDSSKALDASLVVTKCSGTNSVSGIQAADPRMIHMIRMWISNPLKKADRNTTPDSKNMCHRGGEIDQNAKKFTPYYFPKVKEFVLLKPHHVIAPSSSSNSKKELTAMASADNTSGFVPQKKKGVRFSALYLQKKRNLLVFDHSHQHISYFPMLVPSLSGSTVDWDCLFQPTFDEYFNPPTIVVSPVQEVAAPRAEVLADSFVSISINQDAPSTSIPSSQEQEHSPIIS
nr:hypothetical protein [Tanacetum cinerariifolium]